MGGYELLELYGAVVVLVDSAHVLDHVVYFRGGFFFEDLLDDVLETGGDHVLGVVGVLVEDDLEFGPDRGLDLYCESLHAVTE